MVDGEGSSDHNPVIVDVVKRPDALGWVDESFLTTGRTGTWSPSVVWDTDTWAAELGGTYSFEVDAPSSGDRVTMTVTASFDVIPDKAATPDATAQGAVWLGTNGCFQVWTMGNVANVEMLPAANANSQLETGNIGNTGNIPRWVDVAADGVTPAPGVEYTFRLDFDYRRGTYSVAVQYGAEWRPLVARDAPIAPQTGESGGMGSSRPTAFPLAVPATCMSRVKFSGDGLLRSLLGQWFSGGRGLVFSIK